MENKDQPIHPTISHTELGDNGRVLNIYDTIGLSKREWFAGMALQGLISSWGQHDVTEYSELAHDALGFADAILKELDK